MQVKHLEIKSLRGIKDLVLDFHANKPNILIGPNGVGKSTILHALAILLGYYTEFLIFPANQSQVSSRGEVIERDFDNKQFNGVPQLHLAKADASILVEIKDLGLVAWRMSESESESVFKQDVDFQFNNPESYLNLGQAIAQTQLALDKNEARVSPFVYYPVNRQVEYSLWQSSEELSSQWSIPIAMSDNAEAIRFQRVNFSDFFNWFKRQEDLENEQRIEDNNYRDLKLEAIRNAIYSFLPGYSDLRVRRASLDITLIRNGQHEIAVSQLSDGEKGLLALVGDLAKRLAIAYFDSDDVLSEHAIVLIDEIELHLHPKWQRGVVSRLQQTFPNCQFIISTHSPQVISELPPESIYILQQTPDGKISATHPNNSYGRDINYILEEVMDSSERLGIIKSQLTTLFQLIADGNLDAARKLKTKLSDLIGDSEPDFSKADVLIRRKEILGK